MFLKFGQLARAEHDVGPHEMRDHPLLKAVVQMDIEHVVHKRPLEPRAPAAVDRPAASGNLRAPLEVEQMELLVELDMVFKRERERRFFTHVLMHTLSFGSGETLLPSIGMLGREADLWRELFF